MNVMKIKILEIKKDPMISCDVIRFRDYTSGKESTFNITTYSENDNLVQCLSGAHYLNIPVFYDTEHMLIQINEFKWKFYPNGGTWFKVG